MLSLMIASEDGDDDDNEDRDEEDDDEDAGGDDNDGDSFRSQWEIERQEELVSIQSEKTSKVT